MEKAWHFGNTTVRSALRLRDGLIALQKCKLEGFIRGGEGDVALRECLGNEGLVSLGNDPTNSVGRKWRSAMEKMGFIIPKLPKILSDIQETIGEADYISKNGQLLIDSENLQTWQECYLRALSAYRIGDTHEELGFSPFSLVLKVMISLKEQTGDSKLNKDEMALFVQLTWFNDSYEQVVSNIINYREKVGSLKGIDRVKYIAKQYQNTGLNPATLKNDYADTNFRYLKSTGLFKSSRTSVLLDEDKLPIAMELSNNYWKPGTLSDYFEGLCNGAPLPTDDLDTARSTAIVFADKLREYGIHVSDDELNKLTETANINAKRYEFEEELFKIREREFADHQVNCIDEIIAYIDLLLENKFTRTTDDGIDIEIPRAERPAYFEWIVWRAFLAINSIHNPPWHSRNFKVDPDFRPISHASSGSSDLIFEFEDFVLVVEVTLTQSSRQEAAEGEPVRRHVANYVQHYSDTGKTVYGLFLAIKIDTNTANSFRLGEWYLADDTQINVQIVPAPLQDFKYLFESGKNNPNALLGVMKTLIIQCREDSSLFAPDWKNKISNNFRDAIH